MNSRLRKEITSAYLGTDMIAMVLLCGVVMWFSVLAGIICLMLVGGLLAYHRYLTEKKLLRKITEYKELVLQDREDLMDAFSSGAPLMLCVMDRSFRVHWSNMAFEKTFMTGSDMQSVIGKDALKHLFEHGDDSVKVNFADKVFCISSAYLSRTEENFRMLFWDDITKEQTAEAKYEDAMVCLAYVNVDNMDELLQDTPIENRSKIAADIDEIVFGWAKELHAAIYKMNDNRFALVLRRAQLEKAKEKGFSVLNKMHEIEISTDFPASLSIGVSVGEATLTELQEGAQEAIDLALGRGGDQAVVRTKDGETEYFGGSLPSVEKRNKGRSRVMAHALANLIHDADKVIIAGHTRPDMDSFGAAVGIFALVRNSGRRAYIVLESPGDAIDVIYNTAIGFTDEEGLPLYKFVDHEEAERLLTDKTLLVMVDHHRPVLSEDPQLLAGAKKIAVIDHHRRAADAVERPVLSFMETYASSASELVTELLQYSGERGNISRFEAEALLSGINLDTKNFTVSAGVRTFDAGSWLKRNGADSTNIKNYFKTDLSFYQKKLNVIANAEILSNGFAVAYTKDVDPAMQLIVSQAADELLMMRGVDAAIAAGRNGSATMVSARSNGKYNVQTLMEKLGGGGHQTIAAVQLSVGPEEAISQVVQAMRLEGIL